MKREVRLLAQADLILLIADLFRPPEKIRHPLGELKKSNLEQLVEATGLKKKSPLLDQLHRTVKLARKADRDEWAGCYRHLFDGQIVCPINEAGYIRRDKGAILGDICGFYNAFGWAAARGSGERPDHLLAELEFVAMLLAMEAGAPNRDQAEVTRQALANFTRSHLSDWILLFAEQLKGSTSWPLFVEGATLLERTWPALVAWHDWTVDPAVPSTVGICDEPEDPYECGAPDLVPLRADESS